MILTILLVYILLLYNIAPSKMTPKNLSKHPLFEAQNISEYKIKNNFKVILIWTRIQVWFIFLLYTPYSQDLLAFLTLVLEIFSYEMYPI
jgi:hypothetical protein